jgi:hypothetical protein
MIKITLSTREDYTLFILEGQLAGEWVKEFIHTTRQLEPALPPERRSRSAKEFIPANRQFGPPTTSVFDIEGITYVDSLGEEELILLNRMGATFIANNEYGRGLSQRLNLRLTQLPSCA